MGIFGNDENASLAGYNGSARGDHPFRTGEQFGVQIVGMIVIAAWTLFWAVVLFYGMKYTIGIRVSAQVERVGLDVTEHGGKAYAFLSMEKPSQRHAMYYDDEPTSSPVSAAPVTGATGGDAEGAVGSRAAVSTNEGN